MNILQILRIAKPADSLSAVIERYLYSCEIEGKTSRTIEAYRETLAQFLEAAVQLRFPSAIDKIDSSCVYSFLGWVRNRGVSLGTQHRRFRETRAFFSWCSRMGYLTRHPFEGVPNVRPESKVIKPFSRKDVDKLLDQCDLDTEVGVRTRAMILLLLDTGIRRAELENLELCDVDLEAGRAFIRHGKGRKQRVVPFSAEPTEALANYINKYRGRSPGRLFLSAIKGERRCALNKHHLGTHFQRLGNEAGVHANPHRFRHTFATWAIEAGAREIDVQALLGHSTPVMTRRYAATYNAGQAAERHQVFSPVETLLSSGSYANE